MIYYQPSTKHFNKNSAFTLMKCNRHSELHWHGAIEFIYFKSGGLEISLNGKIYTPKANDLIVINSSIVHGFQITSAPVEYYVLLASEEFFKANNLYSDSTFFEPLVRSDKASEIFERIIAEYGKTDELSKMEILSGLMSLFVYLKRNYAIDGDVIERFEPKQIAIVRTAVEYLQNNYKEKLSVLDIANHLHFSKSYLSHVFKQITGYSLIDYINLLRCQNARTMLLDGYSIIESALSSGFSELSYFTRVFKKTMGILPSMARKEVFTIYNHTELN